MKKTICLITMCIILMGQSVFAMTFPPVMQVNGTFVDVGEIVEDQGKRYVQARALADVLGVVTDWDAETSTAYFYKYERRVIVKDGVVFTYVDGIPQGDQGIDTFISSEGRTFLPVDFFSGFFGYNVTWDANSRLIAVTADDVTVPAAMMSPSEDMQDDLKWLARIISIEARGASMYKKVAVANVVLNRVESSQFPSTVYGVVKQQGQFPPAYYSYFDTFEPPMHSYVSAFHALNGQNVVEDCLYFNMVPHRWIPSERFFDKIEGDYFYR